MEIVRLAELARNLTNLTCDVCIVGAGAAGMYLATRLSEHGLRTILVEAGPETCISTEQAGFMPSFERARYSGALEGRAFGFGGTTSRWGGQLFPYTSLDERESADPYAESWRCINTYVGEQLHTVLKVLGVPIDVFESQGKGNYPEAIASALSSVGLSLSASIWLPFRRRNFKCLIGAREAECVTVLLEAVAFKWATVRNQNNHAFVDGLQAIGIDGRRVGIQARQFVIAAGAIESARILLELNNYCANDLLPRDAAVGCYLSDHLSFPLATVQREDNGQAARLFGPRFRNSLMHTVRILGTGASYRKLPRFFAHVAFDRDDEAFALARSVLQAVQMRTLPKIRRQEFVRSLSGFTCLVWQRLVHRKLYIPANTRTHLQLDFEQLPMRRNKIRLGSQLDRYGRRTAILDWDVSEVDRQNAWKISKQLLLSWDEAHAASQLPRLVISDGDIKSDKLYDSYHPVGTCMLGTHAEAVVTPELTVRGTSNLSVLSTGIFPSAGTANPTLSMLCCGEAFAKRLCKAFD